MNEESDTSAMEMVKLKSERAMNEAFADGGEAYEDFDVDDLHGLDALETAIEAFNAANESVVSYRPNYKRALLVNKSNVKEHPTADAAGGSHTQPTK